MEFPKAWLYVEDGPNRGTWYELRAEETVVGRQPGCGVLLPDERVSRQHARIRNSGGRTVVEDLDSRHGTWLDGVPLTGEAPLLPGQGLRVGQTLLRYETSSDPAVGPVAAPTASMPGQADGEAGDADDRDGASRRGLHRSESPPELVAQSPAMREVLDLVRRVAPRATPVLVTGETGTGKERIARAIHVLGPRAAGPFVAVNAASLPESLLESELFGHERGAFSGAAARKRGLFELAHGGTLFLDEVGELSAAAQAALLRVLETGDLRRVGGEEVLRVDVRLVAATHRDLAAACAAGGFRPDLFHRLHGIELHVPPLRERREDLEPLCNVLLAEVLGLRHGRPPAIEPAALARLAAHPFPGNVRELRNCLERALILGDGWTVRAEHLVPAPSVIGHPLVDGEFPSLEDMEKRHVVEALRRARGVRTEAAALLGIDRKTLRKKIADFGLEDAE